MKFLVIPEDFRKDQYILAPLIKKLLEEAGFTKPRIQVCRDPLMGGINEALKTERIKEVLSRYKGMIDIFILCVDRDAEHHRHKRLNELETHFASQATVLASQAWEELETWVLAGLDLPSGWRWQDIRLTRDVKEAFFEPLAQMRNLSSEPGGGRRTLSLQASTRIQRIRQLCREDFDVLGQRLQALRRP